MRRALALLLIVVLAGCASLRPVPDSSALDASQRDAYARAAAALDAGDAANALDAIQPVVAVEPWHVPSHVLRQRALHALDRWDEARAWYRAAVGARPNDAARFLLAARTMEPGSARDAAVRAALALDPASPWARIAVAHEVLRAAAQTRAEATRLADQGWAQDAATAAARAEGAFAEAERLARLAATDRPDLASAHLALSAVLLARAADQHEGETTAKPRRRAVAAAEAAAGIDPGDAAPHDLVGRVRREMAQDDAAAEAFEHAAELAPGDGSIVANLGRVLLDLRRDDEAIDALEAAARLRPDDAWVHVNLGVARFREGDPEGAEEAFARAASIAPLDPRPHEALALARAELGDRHGAADAMDAYLRVGGADRDTARRFIAEMRGPSPAPGAAGEARP